MPKKIVYAVLWFLGTFAAINLTAATAGEWRSFAHLYCDTWQERVDQELPRCINTYAACKFSEHWTPDGINHFGVVCEPGSYKPASILHWYEHSGTEILCENGGEWNQLAMACEKRNAGPACPSAANPINPAQGNKYQVEIDYGRLTSDGLVFKRFYNGLYKNVGPLGEHWSHSYHSHVSLIKYAGAETVKVHRSDGKTYLFRRDNGEWQPPSNIAGRLEGALDANGDATGWRYFTSADIIEDYDAQGRIVSITDRGITTHILSYNTNGRLIAVMNPFGQQLTFIYDASNRITLVTDPKGDEYRYYYDSNNNLISVTYPDDTPGNLTDNPTRQYLYEDSRFPHALTGIVDETGERYATWSYDEQGRAISSEHAGGADRSTLSYNTDGTTTVTNALGKQTTYHFDIIHGVYRVTQVEGHPTASCAGANQAYTYDANGFLASKTDWNGNVTTYVHDDRGLETTRTEGAGTPQARTITTEWHTDFRVPVRITEPGKITEFSYDTNGRLLDRQERSVQ